MRCISCKWVGIEGGVPMCNAIDGVIPSGFVNRDRVRGEGGMCNYATIKKGEIDASRRGKPSGVVLENAG